MNDWDIRFLKLAKEISTASKDPGTKVGSVIVDSKRRIVSTGYNGFPRKIADTEERLSNRSIKYEIVIHSEVNAILFAQRDLSDCTLYTWPFMPCSRCASIVIQSGVSRVVSAHYNNERWIDSFNLTKVLFEEAGVELVIRDDV